MLPPEPPDHIHVAFDDHHLVANAGLTGPTAEPFGRFGLRGPPCPQRKDSGIPRSLPLA